MEKVGEGWRRLEKVGDSWRRVEKGGEARRKRRGVVEGDSEGREAWRSDERKAGRALEPAPYRNMNIEGGATHMSLCSEESEERRVRSWRPISLPLPSNKMRSGL